VTTSDTASNSDPTTPNGNASSLARYLNGTNGVLVDSDATLAHSLQPLLEQEALLESYAEEAIQARKFEDAKTLRTNLDEIRAEISKLSRGGKILG